VIGMKDKLNSSSNYRQTCGLQ